MVDVSVVRRKLRKLEEYVDQLSRLQPESFEAYKASVLHRRAIERLLQLLVEVASDINTHVLVSLGSPPPDDYYDGFIRMGASGVIPQELARRLAPSAGARNILVLEYEVIDDRIVYESVPHALTDFRVYGYNGPRKLDTKRDGFELHLSHGADTETVLTSVQVSCCQDVVPVNISPSMAE